MTARLIENRRAPATTAATTTTVTTTTTEFSISNQWENLAKPSKAPFAFIIKKKRFSDARDAEDARDSLQSKGPRVQASWLFSFGLHFVKPFRDARDSPEDARDAVEVGASFSRDARPRRYGRRHGHVEDARDSTDTMPVMLRMPLEIPEIPDCSSL